MLADKDPKFKRGNFCSVIRNSAWIGYVPRTPGSRKATSREWGLFSNASSCNAFRNTLGIGSKLTRPITVVQEKMPVQILVNSDNHIVLHRRLSNFVDMEVSRILSRFNPTSSASKLT